MDGDGPLSHRKPVEPIEVSAGFIYPPAHIAPNHPQHVSMTRERANEQHRRGHDDGELV